MSDGYECGSCGHIWEPGDGLVDLDAGKCEACDGSDSIIRQAREGFDGGGARGQARCQGCRIEAAHGYWDAYRTGLVQLARSNARKAENAKSEKGSDDG